MKKPSEETKILAHVECLLVWDRMVETGCCKTEAINQLFKEGKISKQHYISGCPFCESFYNRITRSCGFCIWPGIGDSSRCMYENSPYNKWCVSKIGSLQEKEAAKGMLNFLLKLDY